MKSILSIFFLCMMNAAFSSAAEKETYPPKPEIREDSCPFECCQLGTWTALQNIVLLEKPGSKTEVARLKKDEKVTAEGGETHMNPVRIDIFSSHPPFKKGDVVYTMKSVMECGTSYLLNGRYASDRDGSDACLNESDFDDIVKCKSKTADCWGKITGDLRHNHEWWVQLKTKAGKKGWVLYSGELFSGSDSCE